MSKRCNSKAARHTVLPWADTDEYGALIQALVVEHEPRGPIEEHLVEELAGIIWRKRRLRLAEGAAHHRALMRATDPHGDTAKAALIHIATHDGKEALAEAIRANEAQTTTELADLRPRSAGWTVRLHEKSGKEHAMPCHHALADALRAYIDAAGIAEDRKGWLFRTARGHKANELSGRPMNQSDAWLMIRRREGGRYRLGAGRKAWSCAGFRARPFPARARAHPRWQGAAHTR